MYVYLFIFFFYLILHFQEQQHSHIIWWRTTGTPKKINSINCRTPGRIETVLWRHSDFQTIHRENKQKKLKIKMQNNAISNDFPCFLIRCSKKDPLIVTYIEPGNDWPEKFHSCQAEHFVLFRVNIKNGQRIVKNPEHERDVEELTVYAYRKETVREALRRDGRFHNDVFNGHELLRLDNGDTVTLSAHADDVNNVSLKIQSSSQPDSTPDSDSVEDDA